MLHIGGYLGYPNAKIGNEKETWGLRKGKT